MASDMGANQAGGRLVDGGKRVVDGREASNCEPQRATSLMLVVSGSSCQAGHDKRSSAHANGVLCRVGRRTGCRAWLRRTRGGQPAHLDGASKSVFSRTSAFPICFTNRSESSDGQVRNLPHGTLFLD